MNILTIRLVNRDDARQILNLYHAVSAIEGGLARAKDEINEEYVTAFLTKAIAGGVSFVAVADELLVGEIHAYALGPRAFSHVLGELTVAVHPDYQGQGVGSALFRALLGEVEKNRPDILRVELIARESNARAIALYQRLGFVIEGRFEGRIQSVGGGHEADIPMAWRRITVS